MTVNVCPPGVIVIIPMRSAPELFSVTQYSTAPVPVPLDPDLTVSQPEPEPAVHAQDWSDAVTQKNAPVVLAAEETVFALGDTVKVQAGWVTVNVFPPTVIVPVRVVVPVFAVAV